MGKFQYNTKNSIGDFREPPSKKFARKAKFMGSLAAAMAGLGFFVYLMMGGLSAPNPSSEGREPASSATQNPSIELPPPPTELASSDLSSPMERISKKAIKSSKNNKKSTQKLAGKGTSKKKLVQSTKIVKGENLVCISPERLKQLEKKKIASARSR